MLILLCIIWGLTFPATKSALDVVDPMHFLTLRFGIAVLILLPITAVKYWNRQRKNRLGNYHRNGQDLTGDDPCDPNTKESAYSRSSIVKPRSGLHVYVDRHIKSVWFRGVFVGLFLFLGFTMQTIGLRYTAASRSGFFTGLLVVIVPPLAFLLRTSRTPLSSWFGILPAVVGVYLLSDPSTGGLNRGDWLTIACAVVFAMQMIVLEVVARGLEDVWKLTLSQIVTVFIGSLIWSLVEGVQFQIIPEAWLAVAYTAIFGCIIAVWLQTRYQPQVPAGHAALIFTLEPVFAATFAWIILGETWTLQGLFGAALILLAMLVSSYGLKHYTSKMEDTNSADVY